jgi:chromosome segregation ATPase
VTDIGQAVLDAIADLKSTTDRRFAVLESRTADLGSLDGRLAALEAGGKNLDGRLAALDAGGKNLDGRLAVLETRTAGLENLDGRLAALEAGDKNLDGRLAGLEAGIKKLDERLESLDVRTAGLENLDLHFLQSTVRRLLDEARDTGDALRQIEVKMDEVYSSMATSPEIKRLREAVSDSATRERELDIRLSTIESRLGLKNPLQPAT